MKKSVTVTDKEFLKRHEKDYGSFNNFPPNWKELTEKEFAQSRFFVHSSTYTEYRQMQPDKRGFFNLESVFATLYFQSDGSGFAIMNDYWKGKVRYFSFAKCLHIYEELDQEACRKRGLYHAGRCFHVSECAACGHVSSVDSSD